jgi:hypothetical protein
VLTLDYGERRMRRQDGPDGGAGPRSRTPQRPIGAAPAGRAARAGFGSGPILDRLAAGSILVAAPSTPHLESE